MTTTPDEPRGTPPPEYRDGPAYGAPSAYGAAGGGYGAPTRPPRNGLGVAALVLGILALLGAVTVVGGIVFGLLAVILGLVGRGRVKRREATNGGVPLAGVILGVLGLLLSIALVAFGVSVLTKHKSEVQQYRDCLNKAGSNSAAVQACQREFASQVSR
ncbi:MAG: hypothetical protein NVSMB13_21810 [Mycobacteriales bacterium]